MRTSLLIHLYGNTEGLVSWAIFNDSGQLVESAKHVPLNTVPHQPSQTSIVLIAGTEITLTQADIPTKQWNRITQAVPYALEEQLAEEVENLYFALGKREPSSGNIAVAVIARSKMESYLQSLSSVGITPTSIIPDILAVPKPAEGWGLLYLDEIVLVRTGLQTGFAIETDCLNIALPKALAESEEIPPQQIMILSDSKSTPILSELTALGIPLTEQTSEPDILASFAQEIVKNPPLNLLQGLYLPQNKVVNLLRPWRLTASLLILWGGLHLAKQWIEYQQLNQQRQHLNTQIEKRYRKTFPEARKIVNPRVQMEQKLKALRTQQNSTPNDKPFLFILNQISPLLIRTPGLSLKRIDYRQGHFDIQLTVANLPALEHLKQRLSHLKLTVEIQSATSRGKSVESRLRISSEK